MTGKSRIRRSKELLEKYERLMYRSNSKKGKEIARSLRNKLGLGCKTVNLDQLLNVEVEEDFTTLLSSGFRSKGDGVLRSSMFKDMSKLRRGFVESVQESYKFAPSLNSPSFAGIALDYSICKRLVKSGFSEPSQGFIEIGNYVVAAKPDSMPNNSKYGGIEETKSVRVLGSLRSEQLHGFVMQAGLALAANIECLDEESDQLLLIIVERNKIGISKKIGYVALIINRAGAYALENAEAMIEEIELDFDLRGCE